MSWLTWFDRLDLIHVFNYYLILAFVVSTGLRISSYRTILSLILTCSKRWPKLLVLVKTHQTVFLGWPTLLAIALAFALMLCNSLATNLVWPHAKMSFVELRGHWLPLGAVLLLGGLMFFLDYKAVFNVGNFDRTALEVDLDKAESWMNSWMAPTLSIVTLGFLNPRKIVRAEVHRLLVDSNWIVIGGMWRMSLRIGLQLAFGSSLWLTWAFALQRSS